MQIIYVRGGDKTAPEVAQLSGMLYGTRNDYKAYAPVHMIDIRWKNYIWSRYLARVDEYRPSQAMVADYEQLHQKELLYQQVRDLERLHIERIMVCPKFNEALVDIPVDCVIAISVPTTYAGFLPDYRQLRDREVHLLGGRPEIQAEILRKLAGVGAKVMSVDGSYHAMKAGFGQWFDGSQWVQLRRNTVSDTDLCIASGKNIVRYLQNAVRDQQLSLF